MHKDFNQYLRGFKSTYGLFSAAMGATAIGLPALDKFAPPISWVTPASAGAVGIAMLGVFALGTCFRDNKAAVVINRCAIAAAVVGLIMIVMYCYLLPDHVYESATNDGVTVRLVVGTESDYRQEVLNAIAGLPVRPTKNDLIEQVQLNHIDRLFAERVLQTAERKLAGLYLAGVLFLTACFCCLVYAAPLPVAGPKPDGD